MSKTEKGIKKSESKQTVIVHMTTPPKVYGNLSHFCNKNGLSRMEYYKKNFPFEFNGFVVYKERIDKGTRILKKNE